MFVRSNPQGRSGIGGLLHAFGFGSHVGSVDGVRVVKSNSFGNGAFGRVVESGQVTARVPDYGMHFEVGRPVNCLRELTGVKIMDGFCHDVIQ